MRGNPLIFDKRYTTIKDVKDQHQINEEIRDKEVRVISAEGEQLGIMSAAAALQSATGLSGVTGVGRASFAVTKAPRTTNTKKKTDKQDD